MTKISWEKGKKRLAVIWFIGGGILFSLIFAQSILGRYGASVERVWGWFIPTILPTLSLMIAVFVLDTIGRGVKRKSVDKFFYRLSSFLSIVYILSIITIILIEPFSDLSPLELMEQSSIWLGSFQGLVGASIGAFFVKET